MSGDASRPMPSTTRKLVFSVVTVGLALLLVEGAARLWLAVSSRPRPASGGGETDWLDVLGEDLHVEDQDVRLYVPDAELFWTLRPGAAAAVRNVVYETRTRPVRWRIRINEEGHRGAAYPPADVHASPVVVTLGDSATFGFRVDEADTYPALLQEDLRSHGMADAAVVNYGVPGYTSFQGRRLLTAILARHRPDVVVLAFGANDLETDVRSDAAKAARLGPTRLRLAAALGRLAIARVLLPGADRQRSDPGRSASTTRVSDDEFRDNMRSMVRAARRAGARVILLDLVLVGPVFRDIIAAIAREEGVPWIDGREVLRRGLDDLLAGRRFAAERAAIDRFWTEEVERYRLVYYDEAFFRRLVEDPVWRGLLRYLMVEPVHAGPLGNRLIAEAVAEQVRAASGR